MKFDLIISAIVIILFCLMGWGHAWKVLNHTADTQDSIDQLVDVVINKLLHQVFIDEQEEKVEEKGEPLPMPPGLTAFGVIADARLRLQEVPGKGRGIFTAAKLEAGEIVISVPQQALLTGANAIARFELLRGMSVEPDVALTAFLAMYKFLAKLDRGHNLLSYILKLPDSFPTLPLTFYKPDLERELKGTSVLHATDALQDKIEKNQPAIVKMMEQYEKSKSKPTMRKLSREHDGFLVSFEYGTAAWEVTKEDRGFGPPDASGLWQIPQQEWFWASAVVQTRGDENLGRLLQGETRKRDGRQKGMDEEISDEKFKEEQDRAPRAIVPLIDFVNHVGVDPTCQSRLGANGEIQLVTLRPLNAGEELTLDYGQRTAEQYLFQFGFVPEDSPMVATSTLSLERPANDTSIDTSIARAFLLRLVAVNRPNLDQEGKEPVMRAQLRSNSVTGIVDTSELWTAMNILCFSDEELDYWSREVQKAEELPAVLGSELSAKAKAKMLPFLHKWAAELRSPPSLIHQPLNFGHQSAGYFYRRCSGSKEFQVKEFAQAASYRARCLSLVEEAISQAENQSTEKQSLAHKKEEYHQNQDDEHAEKHSLTFVSPFQTKDKSDDGKDGKEDNDEKPAEKHSSTDTTEESDSEKDDKDGNDDVFPGFEDDDKKHSDNEKDDDVIRSMKDDDEWEGEDQDLGAEEKNRFDEG